MKGFCKKFVLRQSLLVVLLAFVLTSCAPGAENPFDGVFDGFGNIFGQPQTEAQTETPSEAQSDITELAPESEGANIQIAESVVESTGTTESTGPLVVEIVETPIDQLEQTLVGAQETSVVQETALSATATTTTTTEESTTEESTVSTFTTAPTQQASGAQDPEKLIIEFTDVESLKADVTMSDFFAGGAHALYAMRDEEEIIGVATLASDGTLSLRTEDVIENSRFAEQTFQGCQNVTREHTADAFVYGGISFFESITVPGLVLTPILDVNGDESYVPAVNYVRLTDPLVVAGICFELETAVESVQASFVPGWNRLLRELDWRHLASGTSESENSNVEKTLWSVNNNDQTVVKWLYERP